jgi:hypothetical protein
MATKVALVRRRSSDDGSLRSRAAGLVITKVQGTSPLIKGDKFALFVRALPFHYGCAFLIARFFRSNFPQPEIQLQRVAHYGRAAALCASGLFLYERPNLRRQRYGEIILTHVHIPSGLPYHGREDDYSSLDIVDVVKDGRVCDSGAPIIAEARCTQRYSYSAIAGASSALAH